MASPYLPLFRPLMCSLALLGTAVLAAPSAPLAFRDWAPTPPMGWNSWDCFGTTVTESQTKAQADFMASKLKAHGWQYIVVDIQWYEPNAGGHDYRPGAPLVMDAHGRLLPALNRFPSAEGGAGFKPLADYVHGLGLKFGIHLMRGIPRQAVEKNLPILGTDLHAADIANKAMICPWNPDMYGVDMSKPGAQAYYDSVFALIASWGVDYVKVDDLSRPYAEHQPEIEAIRRAIDRTGRPMVLSMSPGETALEAAEHARNHANLWRISDDFWDRWLALREQFARLENWNPHRVRGAWPDADMLPLGSLVMGQRMTRFTPDEQFTLMTLWSIARSPLMHGGDLSKTDAFTLSLLTNDEVLAVNQASENNRPLFNRDELVAWTADVPGSKDKYLAVFNARDRVRLTEANACYVSPALSRESNPVAKLEADVTGATRLFLVAQTSAETRGWEDVTWQAPLLEMADGTQKNLAEIPWTKADAIWDGAKVLKDASGKAVGLRAGTQAVLEYALPSGAKRLRAEVKVEPVDRDKTGGTVRFLVVAATTGTEDSRPSLPVEVSLAELGFTGPVRIKDLWTKEELVEVKGSFAPQVNFHGARLFRISPR